MYAKIYFFGIKCNSELNTYILFVRNRFYKLDDISLNKAWTSLYVQKYINLYVKKIDKNIQT